LQDRKGGVLSRQTSFKLGFLQFRHREAFSEAEFSLAPYFSNWDGV